MYHNELSPDILLALNYGGYIFTSAQNIVPRLPEADISASRPSLVATSLYEVVNFLYTGRTHLAHFFVKTCDARVAV